MTPEAIQSLAEQQAAEKEKLIAAEIEKRIGPFEIDALKGRLILCVLQDDPATTQDFYLDGEFLIGFRHSNEVDVQTEFGKTMTKVTMQYQADKPFNPVILK